MAGSERACPGLHAGSLQQLLGLLMPGAQLKLLTGNKGPAARGAKRRLGGGGGRGGGIRKKITRIRSGLTVTTH